MFVVTDTQEPPLKRSGVRLCVVLSSSFCSFSPSLSLFNVSVSAVHEDVIDVSILGA